ncbi:EpsG family protein [Vibrio furnissii]|uniref:EpsG family protein n=1 Tax=Vibrio furnissii TaxID=29494 RepID=UPI003AA7D389
MTAYIIFVLLVFFIIFGVVKYSLNTTYLLVFIVSSLFLGLRYNVGIDYGNYLQYMERFVDGKFVDNKEFLFDKVVQFSYIVLGDEKYSFYIFGCFFLIPLFIGMRRCCGNHTIGLLIFLLFPIFYLAAFNSVRQFISVGFFVFSLSYIINRSFVKYTITILFAALFHKSVLLIYPVYFFLNNSFSVKKLLLFIVAYIVFVKYMIFPFIVLMGFKEKLFMFENTGVNYKSLIFVVFTIGMFLFSREYKRHFNDYNLLVNMMIIASIILVTPMLSSELPSSPILRMSSYFTPALIIYFSKLVLLFNNKDQRLLVQFFIISVSLLYFYSAISNGSSNLLTPYNTYIF